MALAGIHCRPTATASVGQNGCGFGIRAKRSRSCRAPGRPVSIRFAIAASMPTIGLDVSLAQVMDLMVDAVCVVDPAGRFLFVSASGERIFGYRPDEMLGRPMLELVHPDDRQRTLRAVDELVAGHLQPHFYNRYVRKDGRAVDIMWSARWSEAGQVRVAVARDVTALKHAERRQAAMLALAEAAYAAVDVRALLQQVHQIVRGLLPASGFGVALHDATSGRPRFAYASGLPAAEGPMPAAGTLSADVIQSGQPLHYTAQAHAARPGPPPGDLAADALDWLGVPLHGQAGVIGALSVQRRAGDAGYDERDIELLQFVSTQVAAAIERRHSEARLRHLAEYDMLTGLPNRALLDERLRTGLARVRQAGSRFALLYLDLDGFKQVNDTRGHAVGDQLLQEVAIRLCASVRISDTVGRMGGDEFMVLLHDVAEVPQALQTAEKIRAALEQPFALAGQAARVSASIGIALVPWHGDEIGLLLRQADAAMYRAKRDGGNRLCVAEARADHGAAEAP